MKNEKDMLVIDKSAGRVIYGLRMAERRTQYEMAKKVKIDQPSISQYELGQRIPTRRTLQKIADAYNLTLRQVAGMDPINWSKF